MSAYDNESARDDACEVVGVDEERIFRPNPGEWAAVNAAYREIDAARRQVQASPDGPERDRACSRLADLLEAQADREERSELGRMLASGQVPDTLLAALRAEAAEYRAGRDPDAAIEWARTDGLGAHRG